MQINNVSLSVHVMCIVNHNKNICTKYLNNFEQSPVDLFVTCIVLLQCLACSAKLLTSAPQIKENRKINSS